MQHPTDLIQVSFNSQGIPQSCFVSAAALERRQAGGCVAEHQPDGTPIMLRWPGDRDLSRAMLNVKNIIVRGNPLLPEGWQKTTQADADQFWQEFATSCGLKTETLKL